MITDKSSEHTLLLLLLICGLFLVRILMVHEFRKRYIAVFITQDSMVTREIAGLAVLTVVTMLVIPAVDLTTGWIDFADFGFFGWVACCGIAIALLAAVLLWRIQYDWVMFFQQAGERRDTFISCGIYRFIRHPFHAVLLLLAVAQMLMLQNWLAGLAGIATFLIVYMGRVPVDELRALELYGHSYLDYMDRTDSIVPRVSLGLGSRE